jgi:hypothetical protein
MAGEAALTAKLEVRLTTLERQLKKAGVMADGAVRDIEDRFARANPRLGGAAAIGGFIGGLSSAAFQEAFRFLDSLNDRFKEITDTAKLTGLALRDVFAVQEALGNAQGVAKALESVATLLDRAGRGETNNLGRLLEVNGQSVANVRDAADAWNRVVEIIARAQNEIQAREMGAALGVGPEVVAAIREAGANYDRLFQTARDGSPDIKALADLAAEFDAAWKAAVDAVKAYFLEGFRDIRGVVANFIETTARELQALENIGAAVGKFFTGQTPAPGVLGNAATTLQGAATALRDSEPLRLTVGGRGGGRPAGPASRPLPVTDAGRSGGGGSDALNAFEREERRARERIELMQLETRLIGANTQQRTAALEALRLEQMAKREGIPITAELNAKIQEQAQAYGTAASQMEMAREHFRELRSGMAELSDALAGAFEQMIFEGAKLNDVLAQMGRRLASRALQRLFDTLLLGSPSGGGGLLSLLTPRAAGGPVSPGRAYMVGERGREMFVPRTPGMIVPNSALRSAGGPTSVSHNPIYNITPAQGVTPSQLAAIIDRNNQQFVRNLPMILRQSDRRFA